MTAKIPPVLSSDIWRWPEFLAFWERLGFASVIATDLIIQWIVDEPVRVTHDGHIVNAKYTSIEVLNWPELRQLLARLGVVELEMVSSVMILAQNYDVVRVIPHYIGQDKKGPASE